MNANRKRFGSLFGKTGKSSLFLILIILFAGQIIFIVGLTGYVSYRNGQDTVYDMANDLIAETGLRIDLSLSNYIQDVEKITRTNASLVRSGNLDPGNIASVSEHFREQLHNYELVSTIAMATEHRDFVALEKDNISFILREYDKNTLRYTSYRLDESGRKIGITGVLEDYDPLRDPPHDPFYEKARNGPFWRFQVTLPRGISDPELMLVSFLPILDRRNTMLGVTASSIYLSHFGQFLTSLRIGQSGQAFVVDKKGYLVATSTGEPAFRKKGVTTYPETMEIGTERFAATDSRNPVTSAAMRAVISQYGELERFDQVQKLDFEFSNNRYLARIIPFKKADLDLLTIIAVPEMDFMAHIDRNMRHTLLFSSLALLIAIAMGILTARWVTSPILRLNAVARAIAGGEMDGTVDIVRGDEIGELANTFNVMAAKLKTSFEMLQKEIAERKQAEETIRESEERFRCLLQSVPAIAVQGYRLDGTTTYWNQASESLYGYTAEEAIGSNLLDLIIPREMCEEVAESIRRMGETGQPMPSAELDLMRKDGSRIAVFSNHALVEVKGLPAELFCLDVDLTERKRAEAAIQATELRYRNLFEDAPVMYLTFRRENNLPVIASCNEAFTNTLGYTKDEVVGRPMSDFMSEASIACMKVDFPRLLEGAAIDGERELIARDGRIISTLIRAVRELDSQGRIIGTLAMFTDISDRKIAEDKLHLAEFSIESSGLPTFWFDRQSRVVRVNEASCRALGYTREELLGMRVGDFDFDYQAEEKWDSIWEEVKRRRNYVEIETSHRSKDGRFFPVEVVSSYFQYGGKEYIFSFARDISNRKQMEEEKARLEGQLYQAQKMEAIGSLAGGIAHDFNNILSAIMGFTEMALDDPQMDDRRRHYLEQVFRAGERARDLVRQILAFSRQKKEERGPVLVAPVIKEGIKLLRSSLPATIDIIQNIPDESIMVLADPTRIHQVLMNLCTNASHAMREKGGVLDVRLVRERVGTGMVLRPLSLSRGDYARLTVSDTGHGIDPAIMDRIFDPFFTSKSPGEGTGLGLSVVYGIIRDYGGAIDVFSEPGKGTTISCYFPLIESEEVRQEQPHEPFHGGGERILFIDDEAVLAELGSMMLTSLGYRVTCAVGSIAALEMFRTSPYGFDLVITDITMPTMRGDHLAVELLKIRPDIPIVLCTGYSETISEEKAAELGIRAYVLKPITRHNISAVIRKILTADRSGVWP